MAKMFYTLEEVAQKLGKSEDDVREMAASGQIQEFRDRDKLMFKVDQIDLLAGGDEDTTDLQLDLEDTAGGLELGASGTDLGGSGLSLGDSGLDLADTGGAGLDLAGTDAGDPSVEPSGPPDPLPVADDTGGGGLDLSDSASGDSREGTGLSIFDTDAGLEDTGAGDTAVGDTVEDELSLEAVGSGSGLLDLTRESDDTSLGAELLEEVYSSDDNIDVPANASGLFEAAGADSAGNVVGESSAPMPGMAMPMAVETYDGTGSGLGVGLMIGAAAALVVVAIITIVGASGATPELAMKFADNLYVFAGGLLGVTIVFGLIGLFIGKASQ